MISKKLRHETQLDYQMRLYTDDKNKLLDSQGRHRSEWCYSPYDGRSESPNEKIEGAWGILLDRYSGRKT